MQRSFAPARNGRKPARWPNLFPVILDLAIQAVNAQRGVLLILEGGSLVPRARKGEGFRISSAVRDRVLNEKSSILVRDAQLDDAFKGRMSIVEHKVHTMMRCRCRPSTHHRPDLRGLAFRLREFTTDDLSLLTVMANVAAIRIENARLPSGGGRAHMQRDSHAGGRDPTPHAAGRAPQVPGADLRGFNAGAARGAATTTLLSDAGSRVGWHWRRLRRACRPPS